MVFEIVRVLNNLKEEKRTALKDIRMNRGNRDKVRELKAEVDILEDRIDKLEKAINIIFEYEGI
jgi:ribosome recycling factor